MLLEQRGEISGTFDSGVLLDQLTVEEFGIDIVQMMEQAGLAELVRAELGGDLRDRRVIVAAGPGNCVRGDTGADGLAVRDLAAELASAVGIPDAEVQEIAWSAMLHDVGKLRVPDRVLLKPGRLDEDEWALIRQHPIWGEQLLMGDDGFALARRIARWHHENWDGSGYPDGLRGEAIPVPARIVRVVDVFDALRSERPYKPAWSLERSLEELHRMRGTGLDPDLVDLFVRLRNSG